jgi:hypothetical protein
MSTAYIEMTIPSYLVARPSRDLLIAARQPVTCQWWEEVDDDLKLFVSNVVLQEIGAGDALLP